ncbi:Cell number regulator 10 [Morella rubra]|uniref:Cell number regulator 10 n=1 Tax=Morella rubra TaxID=262757 RepID=A0A6A1VJ31_9ROSI|nr:Cell number regulator 10 [Morella rubra]
MPPYASQAGGQWSSGLCDCFNDPSNCCLTWCCPCVTFGRIAEVTDRGQTSCFMAGLIYVALAYVGCQCLYSMTYRSKLRGSYSLPEDPCGDCCVHLWCDACALCQEHRELKARGLDPAIGRTPCLATFFNYKEYHFPYSRASQPQTTCI